MKLRDVTKVLRNYTVTNISPPNYSDTTRGISP
jgi:hypothetical protein